MFKPEIYINRRNKLTAGMPEEFAIIVPPASYKPTSADGKYPYSPNVNLAYLTGITQPGTWLIIHRRKGEDVKEVLFIKAYNETHAKWIGTVLTKEEATEKTGIDTINFNNEVQNWISRLVMRFGIANIWYDFPLAGIQANKGTRVQFAAAFRNTYPHINLQRISEKIFSMRMIKEPCELDAMKKAIDLSGRGFTKAVKALNPGMMEYEFEAELLYEFMMNNQKTPAFSTIVAGGKRATCLHYGNNNQPLEDGTLLLLDFGARFGLYNSDISRTVPVNGKYSQRQRELVEMVISVQNEAIRLLLPGKLHSAWNEEVKEFYAELLLEKEITQEKEEIEKFYYHKIGHHIGLDTHDENIISEEFQEGMVLTVEPGFYSEEEGIGIRIEDDILIGADKNINLTSAIPKHPGDIEALMANAD